MSQLNFPCTSCGLCCRHVGAWVKQARKMVEDGATGAVEEAANFPHAIDEDGACSKLGEDNRCTIYDSRPLICSITGTWAKHFSGTVTIESYYKQAALSCNKLISAAKLDKKFIVKI